MKVASVSSVYYRPQCRKGALKQHSDENSGVVQKDVSFKGNFGKIVGRIRGCWPALPFLRWCTT